MKLIIAGSRTIKPLSKYFFRDVLLSFDIDIHNPDIITEIISGGANGVDSYGEHLARAYTIPLTIFRAEWDKHGKPAGVIRNKQMAEHGDALLLVWDGKSAGSANMKLNMEKLNKTIYEVIIRNNNV